MRFSIGGTIIALLSLAHLPAGFGAGAPADAGAPRPILLDEAFNAFLEHQGRWAYTETRYWVDLDGKPGAKTIIRVDPSRSYPERFTPIMVNGRPPDEKDFAWFKKHGESEAKRRQELADSEKSDKEREEGFHLQIMNQRVTPLIAQATVVTEDETTVTYRIPLRLAGGAHRPLYEKHELTARVSKQSHQFDGATLRQLVPMRIVFGKYSDGLSEIQFSSADPQYPTVQTKTSTWYTNKPLFGKAVRPHNEMERSDYKHVTPYEERFGVKIGPLRTIEF